MTITSAASLPYRAAPRLRSPVIIVAALLGAAPAGATGLTTSTTSGAPDGPATTLTTVVIEGATVYDAPRLFDCYAAQLGRPVSRELARAVINDIADLYVRDGYARPEVAAEESTTPEVLRVRVYEAQVSRVRIEGGGRFTARLERIGARLEDARPLRKDDVPNALREMRQLAGLSVTASTRRDPAARNAFEVVVKTEFSPVDGVVRMNNRGTDQVGPAFLLGQVFANGLFGRGEKIGLVFAAATDRDEYLGGGLFADTPLGQHGTRGNLLLFQSRSAPNEAPLNLDDTYSRRKVTLRVSHQLRQGTGLSLQASAALDADHLSIDRDGSAVREDRLRIVETALRAGWSVGATQFSSHLQLRQGLDGLGAGLQATDLVDDPRRTDFFVVLLQTSVHRRFATDWTVRVDTFAQTSGHVLPDSERFKIGGDRLGRGFEVAEIAGDSGLGGKLELRRDLLNTDSFVGRLSTYGFYDIGAAWKQDRPGRESATTAGLGLALRGAELTGYLELAAPLTGADVEGKREPSVFAELSYRF